MAIRATCHDCGDVELTNADVTVLVEPTKTEGVYRFTCPTCRKIVLKPAPGEIVELLVTSGVKLVPLKSPAMEDPVDAPALDDDDLIDLGLALQDDAIVERELQKLLAGE